MLLTLVFHFPTLWYTLQRRQSVVKRGVGGRGHVSLSHTHTPTQIFQNALGIDRWYKQPCRPSCPYSAACASTSQVSTFSSIASQPWKRRNKECLPQGVQTIDRSVIITNFLVVNEGILLLVQWTGQMARLIWGWNSFQSSRACLQSFH